MSVQVLQKKVEEVKIMVSIQYSTLRRTTVMY